MKHWTKIEEIKYNILDIMVAVSFKKWGTFERRGDNIDTIKKIYFPNVIWGNWLFILKDLKTYGFLDNKNIITEKGERVIQNQKFNFKDRFRDIDIFKRKARYIKYEDENEDKS